MNTKIAAAIGVFAFLWTVLCTVLGIYSEPFSTWPVMIWGSPFFGYAIYLLILETEA